LQYFGNLRNLDESLHFLDLLIFASEQHELPLELFDLLGKAVESFLSLVCPEEVRIQALINLSLLVYS
jgi:hypothetical protein